MNWLIAQVSRFNSWYDGLAGTPRFLLFLGLMMVSVFSLNLGLNLHDSPASKYLISIGLINTLIVGWVAVIRANGLGGPHKLVAKILGFMLIGTIVMVAVVS